MSKLNTMDAPKQNGYNMTMTEKYGIEWTNKTWNPLVGCTRFSDGCKNCYAEPIARRFQEQGIPGYENGFKLTLRPERLEIPLHWSKPCLVFVDSMCDLFHDDVPLEYIKKVFDIMRRANQHNYQILTKRAHRLAKLAPQLDWMPHVMMGVTIESDNYRDRIDALRATPAAQKFLSLEPLIGRIERLDLTGIDWVIVGGESGNNARPMQDEWVREILDWTQAQGVAFWYKQHSECGCEQREPTIDGKYYKEFPIFKRPADLFG